MRILPVIMSGGSGTRLWPLSTSERPKQFHALGGDRSMIGETAARLTGRCDALDFLAPVIIAGEAHANLVDELLTDAGIEPSMVILEPEGRNTAATAALAALAAQEIAPDAAVLLMPADHVVTKPDALRAAVARAAGVVADRIVTFGILPNGPETGYGYIREGEKLAEGVFAVATFTEKPKLEVAEAYLAAGGYSWNSGVFFFRPAVMLEEFGIAAAGIRDGARTAFAQARRSGRRVHLDPAVFAAVDSKPVDIAVMEKTKRAAVTPCEIGWADIGSWSEYWRFSGKDAQDNSTKGSVTLVDGERNLVLGNGVHVSVAGVSDLIIVATRDAVLVLPRDRAQDVKSLIPKTS
ncbi:NTP transferase domain-containing protein [bacterium]|nr:NTP transferase domain-containing protein [bacterium]